MFNPFKRKSLLRGAPDRSPIETTSTPQRYIRLYGGRDALSYEQIYRSFAAVRAVVDFLAVNAAEVPLHAWMREGDAVKRLSASNDLERLIRRPNRLTSGFEFRRDLIIDSCISGFHLSVKVRDEQERLAALVRIPPSRVSTVRRDDTEPLGYSITFQNGVTKEYAREDVLFVGHHAPDGGLPPSKLESLRDVLAEDREATLHRASYWKNAGRVGSWIERSIDSETLTDVARQRLLEDYHAQTTGRENEGKVWLAEEGMTLHESNATARDAQYVEAREGTVAMIAAVFGVPRSLLGLGELRNMDASQRGLVLNSLSPYFTLIEDAVDRDVAEDLLGDQAVNGRVYVEHVIEERSRGNFQQQAKILEASVGGPFVTPNEARRMFNMPPVDGGDALLLPASTVLVARDQQAREAEAE